MTAFIEFLVALHIVLGAFFIFVGSVGLIKLPDLLSRLHAPTKATTLGVGGTLIASMIYFWGIVGHLSIHELLITGFLFFTAPITAHFMAKAYLHTNQKERAQLPQTPKNSQWSQPAPEEN